MLKILNIKKTFGDREILKKINFEAASGHLTILEGQNGAGKSTLFNILIGNMKADSGNILLDDIAINDFPAIKRASDIAILKQDPKLSSAPSLSVMENCALALLKNSTAGLKPALNIRVRKKIIEHLKSLKLAFKDMLDLPIGMLSGGQRQILAFAMATMIKPKLLLLDEPSAALDDDSSQLLLVLIKGMVKEWNIPALMISHDHALNQAYGDKIVVLKDGMIKI